MARGVFLPRIRLCSVTAVAALAVVAGWPLVVMAQSAGAQEAGPRVLATTVTGPITPVTASHLEGGVRRAARDGYNAYVVRLDTPGGLDTAMRDIIQEFLTAPVPVVVYVSPSGARAASAGALITLSAHVAAMAPGTAIGAATPVALEGGEVGDKVVNDAIAYAVAVAEARDRNTDFAAAFVREARSVPASEALEAGVIDLVAGSLDAVLDEIDGRTVTVAPGDQPLSLRTAGAAVDEHDMGFFRSLQRWLADPNLAILFMSLGTLALIYELASPGMGAGGIVGVTLLLLALFSLAVLPVNVVGVLFILLAAALFAGEVLAPGVGVLAAGGTVSLVLGAVFLFDDAPGLEVSLALVLPVALVVGGGTVLAGRLALRARGEPSTTTGMSRYIGQVVRLGRAEGDEGQVFLDGAWWRVESSGPELAPGAKVRIEETRGLLLVVTPVDETAENEEASQP